VPLDSCSPCVLHESQGKPKHGVQLLAVDCSDNAYDNAYALSALEKLHFVLEKLHPQQKIRVKDTCKKHSYLVVSAGPRHGHERPYAQHKCLKWWH
jgi:hypothetical protein